MGRRIKCKGIEGGFVNRNHILYIKINFVSLNIKFIKYIFKILIYLKFIKLISISFQSIMGNECLSEINLQTVLSISLLLDLFPNCS